MKFRGILVAVGIALLSASPAQGAVQSLHVVNQVGVSAGWLRHVERAISEVANGPLRRAWHTPRIRFGRTGWTVTLTAVSEVMGTSGTHGYFNSPPMPNAPFADATGRGATLSRAMSHEIFEMLVDPTTMRLFDGWSLEVCDPVAEDLALTVHGVTLADFVSPAWFQQHSRGPWDFDRALTRPGDLEMGYLQRADGAVIGGWAPS